MAKKPAPCMELDCDRRPVKGRRRCYWHQLPKMPMEVQEEAADLRLAAHARSGAEYRARVPMSEWPEGYRWCSGCQTMVPDFYTQGSRCKACNSKAAHRSAAERKYLWPAGMTYDKLLAVQGGRCAICRCTPRTRRLAIDHDHETGYVRGLLCMKCNHELLGAAQDNVQILRNAVYYLEHPPALVKVA